MSKVKISCNNLSGKGAQVEIDGVKISQCTDVSVSMAVGQPVRVNVGALAMGVEIEIEAHTTLKVAHVLSDISKQRLRTELDGDFEKMIGHGTRVLTVDEILAAVDRAANGRLKP